VGSRLSVDMHLLTIEAGAIETLLHCVKRCDLELAGMASAPYVSGISSLVEDEQELGAACIDMGGGSTSLSIFMKRHMIFADTVRMGGDHVTADISHGLQIPMPHAERIKARFGGVMATGLDDREIIELQSETGDWHHDRRTVSRSELIGVMRPRIEEILEETRARLDAAGLRPPAEPAHRPDRGGEPSARARRSGQPHPRQPGAPGPSPARAGPAAIGLRARLFGLRGPRAFRGASAGRVVGFRDAGRPLPGAQRETGRPVVPRQLVSRTRSI
jgi:hypothetical protein